MLRRINLFFLLLFSLSAWANGVVGLNYETYRGTGPSPNTSPLTFPTVLSTGVSQTINFQWGGNMVLNSGRSEQVIVRWTGWINIPQAGLYSFGGNADDGIRININNISVVNSWIESGGAFRSGNVNLPAGAVPVEVWYYENGGGAMMNFQWYVQSTGTWQIVPSTMLATTSTYWAPPAPQYSSGITGAQQTSKTTNTNLRQSQQGNLVDIEQIGDNNSITIRQGSSLSGKNRMEVYANGNNNTLNLNQGYLTDGLVSPNDSNNHYLNLNLMGNTNTVTTRQTGTAQYMETTISGNSNVLNLHQQGTGSKTLFTNVVGNSNSVTVNQKDSGQHYLDIRLQGNGHTVNAVQEGSGNHAATINLTNSGGSSNLNLNQLGSTAQTYSITESCVNPAGCNTTITQGQ